MTLVAMGQVVVVVAAMAREVSVSLYCIYSILYLLYIVSILYLLYIVSTLYCIYSILYLLYIVSFVMQSSTAH